MADSKRPPETELPRLVGDLRRAVGILRGGPAAPVDEPAGTDEIDVRMLMERIRAEADARVLASADLRPLHLDLPRFSPQLPAVTAAFRPIELRDAYDLGELLVFADEEFVRNAYRAVMRRESDPDGLAYHLKLLYQGVSRVGVLVALRKSVEGRRAGVRIRGLAAAGLVYRVRNIPVVGWLVGTVLYVLRLPMLVGNLERQETLAYRRERELRAAIDGLAATLAARTAEAVEATGVALTRIERDKAARDFSVGLMRRLATMRLDFALLEQKLAQRTPYEEIQPLAQAALEALAEVGEALAALERSDAELRAKITALEARSR